MSDEFHTDLDCYSDMQATHNTSGDDDELRMAARAGLILLEKNTALQVDLEDLSSKIHHYEIQQQALSMEVESLRKQRSGAVMEVQAANKEIKTLQLQLHQQQAAWRSTEKSLLAQIQSLTLELHGLKTKPQVACNPPQEIKSRKPDNKEEGNQSDEHESQRGDDPRLALLRQENSELQVQLQQASRDIRQREAKWSKSTLSSNQRIQALEHDLLKLSRENKMIKQEQAEERELLESLRTMMSAYKNMMDANPQATTSDSVHFGDNNNDGGVSGDSMHEDVLRTNATLQGRIKELENIVEKISRTPLEWNADAVPCAVLNNTKHRLISVLTSKKHEQTREIPPSEETNTPQDAFPIPIRSSNDKTATDDLVEDARTPPRCVAAASVWVLLVSWVISLMGLQATSCRRAVDWVPQGKRDEHHDEEDTTDIEDSSWA
ncbi:hypothetical protein LEN26_000149 [Aphanomyces euteiches]|nr:hypothetical protein AeMF1_010825 [Aphanomyces euteiches]KAH9164190.1 hypothetical protein LEN26_000149 [Aphanomyces euteiches]KAH9197020.1 hypothetical protein AeNC1_001014 [Aphanomyces euteiches]